MTALRRWLEAALITESPLFRAIDQWGHLKPNGLYVTSISPILKSLGQHCGFDFIPELASHSLRRGLTTGAARAGASFESIKRQCGLMPPSENTLKKDNGLKITRPIAC